MKLSNFLIQGHEHQNSGSSDKKNSFSLLKKGTLIFLLFQVFVSISSAQIHQVHKGQVDSSKAPVLDFHYQPEYTTDSSTEPARWDAGQKGLQAGFGSV